MCTLGQVLFDELIDVLKHLNLILMIKKSRIWNDSNMKGKYKGIQKRVWKVNLKTLYTPCDCYSLDLTICNMKNSCIKAKSFFRIVQCICILFSSSTKS